MKSLKEKVIESLKSSHKDFIDNLIKIGIDEYGENFWLDETEDLLEYWEDPVNIEEFIDDTSNDYCWINPKSKESYNKNDLIILTGEVEYKGDWYIRQIMDKNEEIIAIFASID